MRVYIATAFELWRQAAQAHIALLEAGHEPASRWVNIARDADGSEPFLPGDLRRVDSAVKDLEDLRSAGALILLAPARGGCGCWLELGYAIGIGLYVCAVGPVADRTIFGELIPTFETVEQAIASLAPPGAA